MAPFLTQTRRALCLTLLALAVVLGAVMLGSPVMAASLEDAKAAGLVGEQPDGFLGSVPGNPPADIDALIRDINGKRLAAYTDIATKNGTTVQTVGALAAQKIYNEARPGTYLMVNGRWVKK